MGIQTQSETKYYTLFAMLILVNGICSSLLGARLINLNGLVPGSVSLSGGIIPFCISFVLLDIVTNQYGYRKAQKIIVYYLICKAVMCLLLYVTMKINVAPEFHDETSYNLVIGLILRSFWASFVGTVASFFLNCYVFSKLYISFKGRHLWLRCLVSTTLGEIVFSLVSTPILFYDRLTTLELITLIFHNYTFKIVFEIITLPLIYFLIYLLNKYEVSPGIQYENFIPLHKEVDPSL